MRTDTLTPMNMKKRVMGVFVSLLVAIGLVAVAGTPAEAVVTQPASCPSVHLCLYNASGFNTAEGYELMPTGTPGVCHVLTFRNKLTSLWNASGRTIRVYRDTGCNNDYASFGNAGYTTHIGLWLGVGWNDAADAVMFV